MQLVASLWEVGRRDMQFVKAAASGAASVDLADFARLRDTLQAIGEGRGHLGAVADLTFSDGSPVRNALSGQVYGDFALPARFGGDISKLGPDILGARMRELTALRHAAAAANSPFKSMWSDARIFDNPEEGGAKLTPDELYSKYMERAASLTGGAQKAYADKFAPRPVGALEQVARGGDIDKGIIDEVTATQKSLRDALGIKPVAATTTQANADAIRRDPNTHGFADWMTNSWSNIAVPAGFLAMLFGGDMGKLIGGIAVVAGGYDMYNRYKVLTKDPVAQTAIKRFVNSGFSNGELAKIEKELGPRYSRAASDFYAAARYGFLTTIQNRINQAGVAAHKALRPRQDEAARRGFESRLLGASTPGETPTGSTWGSRALDTATSWFAPPQEKRGQSAAPNAPGQGGLP